MIENNIYSSSKEIVGCGFASLDVYHMKPKTVEGKHYHKGIEVVFVLSGKCKTHRRGRLYLYRKGQEHQVINDSSDELVIVCLTIPPESKKNTVFI